MATITSIELDLLNNLSGKLGNFEYGNLVIAFIQTKDRGYLSTEDYLQFMEKRIPLGFNIDDVKSKSIGFSLLKEKLINLSNQ